MSSWLMMSSVDFCLLIFLTQNFLESESEKVRTGAFYFEGNQNISLKFWEDTLIETPKWHVK